MPKSLEVLNITEGGGTGMSDVSIVTNSTLTHLVLIYRYNKILKSL